MANAAASIRVPASAEKVWDLAGGFNSLPDWLPGVTTSELGEGGRLRSICLESGEIIVERLEYFDNQGRTYSYSITEGAFPVTDFFRYLPYYLMVKMRRLLSGPQSSPPMVLVPKKPRRFSWVSMKIPSNFSKPNSYEQ